MLNCAKCGSYDCAKACKYPIECGSPADKIMRREAIRHENHMLQAKLISQRIINKARK